jgi:hypothetical protein
MLLRLPRHLRDTRPALGRSAVGSPVRDRLAAFFRPTETPTLIAFTDASRTFATVRRCSYPALSRSYFPMSTAF